VGAEKHYIFPPTPSRRGKGKKGAKSCLACYETLHQQPPALAAGNAAYRSLDFEIVNDIMAKIFYQKS
jgi:hypothetical protein